MKTLLILLIITMSVSAKNVVPTHKTTYHDTTVTTQLSYVETEDGYIQEVTTSKEITAPRREPRQKQPKRKGRFVMVRAVTLVTGVVMTGVAISASTKANEYQELQGMANFNNNMGVTNTADYTYKIEEHERRAGIALGVAAGSVAMFGVTFFF